MLWLVGATAPAAAVEGPLCSGAGRLGRHFSQPARRDRAQEESLRPEFWIGILAVVGGLVGFALYRWIGWLGTGTGVVIGILIGTILYTRLREKK